MKKYSDFPGYNKIMTCIHIFQYVHHETCPDCGRYTHEPDLDLSHKLFVEYYKSDKPKEYICPVEGGTIRGWWSI